MIQTLQEYRPTGGNISDENNEKIKHYENIKNERNERKASVLLTPTSNPGPSRQPIIIRVRKVNVRVKLFHVQQQSGMSFGILFVQPLPQTRIVDYLHTLITPHTPRLEPKSSLYSIRYGLEIDRLRHESNCNNLV
jgi:hypothetical protein